jgi:hypothetical protein
MTDPRKGWSAEEDELVLQMVAKGGSLADAARQLPGRSRNSVIGRWNRVLREVARRRGLHLLSAGERAKQQRKAKRATREKKEKKPKRERRIIRRRFFPEDRVETLENADDASAIAKLMALRADQCRWIEGDLEDPDWYYCTRSIEVGSYCAEHAERVYGGEKSEGSLREAESSRGA